MSPENLSQSDITYLEDSSFTIETPEFSRPIKFYGSPWQPWFYDWAFNLPRLGTELQEKWNRIPEDTDVLITHTPPNGYGDLVNNWKQPNTHVGCECLISRVGEINPLVNIFGHIHEGYGVQYGGKTLFVNAAICTAGYEPTNKPIVIDLVEINGKINAIYVEE
jgi:Icc-related predicted phosphoesterase